jgi:hypothetical protein
MNNQTDGGMPQRLQILGEDEIEAVYGRPIFNYEERALYFSLSAPEKAALKQFHTFQSRIFYILQLGLFRDTCKKVPQWGDCKRLSQFSRRPLRS